jgi:hypothetical protein
MDKRKLYRNIAKRAGIIAPEIEYYRERKAYSIGITIKTPDGKGFYAPSIGLYESPQDAEGRIADDLKAFLEKHPEAREKVTISYKSVTKQTPKQASRELLQRLLAGEGNLALNAEVQRMAKATLEYLEKLETLRPKPKATGIYRSLYPNQKKKALKWKQPIARQAPIYTFEVDCPYCGRHVTMERFSPREPQHCGQDECYTLHERELARVRKQRQRAREKGS